MRAICEKGLDHDSSQAGMTEDYADQILVARGHGPALILLADSPDAIVNGFVAITFCDTRTLGKDVVEFSDGHMALITAENVESYFNDQGHQLSSIAGDKAYGKSLITVTIYEEDELPGQYFNGTKMREHKTHFKRPETMPTEDDLRSRIEAWEPRVP